MAILPAAASQSDARTQSPSTAPCTSQGRCQQRAGLAVLRGAGVIGIIGCWLLMVLYGSVTQSSFEMSQSQNVSGPQQTKPHKFWGINFSCPK